MILAYYCMKNNDIGQDITENSRTRPFHVQIVFFLFVLINSLKISVLKVTRIISLLGLPSIIWLPIIKLVNEVDRPHKPQTHFVIPQAFYLLKNTLRQPLLSFNQIAQGRAAHPQHQSRYEKFGSEVRPVELFQNQGEIALLDRNLRRSR